MGTSITGSAAAGDIVERPDELGAMLRSLRRRAGLTQEALANLASLGVRTICDLERGRARHPHRESVRLIADALGLKGAVRGTFERAAAGHQPPSVRVGAPPPSRLPADVADFTGRRRQVSALLRLLTGRPVAAPPIAAISGRAGVGKTALAVHVAHRVRERFPDGQLYVDLRGDDAQPRPPEATLVDLLRALGVDGRSIPRTLRSRAEMYRLRISQRRVLVVLDNVVSERQVRPLLPGSPFCAVLVTSRARLLGLEAAHHVELEPLSAADALRLLERLVGRGRVAEEPEAAARLLRLCERLPLAIRIAGAKLAARPHWSAAELARRLTREQRRLDELAAGDLQVRASLAVSYRELTPQQRRVLRILGLLWTSTVASWVVAATLDIPLTEADDLVDALVDARLGEVVGRDAAGQIRYRLHELVRLYARELAEVEELAARQAEVLESAFGTWLALAEEAARRRPGENSLHVAGGGAGLSLPPELVDRLLEDPMAWLESERESLLAAVEQSASVGLHAVCWQLAGAVRNFFFERSLLDDWKRTHDMAWDAACRARSRLGRAVVAYGRGALEDYNDRYARAGKWFERAATGFRGRSHVGEAWALCRTANALRLAGRHDEAIGRALAVRSCFRDEGERNGEGYALLILAAIAQNRDQVDRAIACWTEALAAFREARNLDGECETLTCLGISCRLRGEFDRAVGHQLQALVVARAAGSPFREATTLQQLAHAYVGQGRLDEARGLLDRCLHTAGELGSRDLEARSLRVLGELCLTERCWDEAIAYLQRALGAYRKMGVPLRQAQVLHTMGAAAAGAGDLSGAAAIWERALAIFESLGAAERHGVAARLEAIRPRASGAEA